MSEKIKTGNEIVDDFFNDITKIEGVDSEIAAALYDLHVEGKLTDTNIKNKLSVESKDTDPPNPHDRDPLIPVHVDPPNPA